MVVHYDSGKRYRYPFTVRPIPLCGQYIYPDSEKDKRRITYDREKITCKKCLKELANENAKSGSAL